MATTAPEFNSEQLRASQMQTKIYKPSQAFSDDNEQSINRAAQYLKQQTNEYDQVGLTHISALLKV